MDSTVFQPLEPTAEIWPQELGRYKLRRLLGKGGMGRVFLAYDTLLEREVALKIPAAQLLSEPASRERFFAEARAAARLRHPNLCPVLDLGESGGSYFLTMPYVGATTLMARCGAPPQSVARLVATVARAMAFAHSMQVVHRDLKPDNVLLNEAGEPVVSDFGLALRLDLDLRLIEAGSVEGTLSYMPPEQASGDLATIGPLADVYSLGVILFQLLTRQLPFAHERFVELLNLIHTAPPPAPSSRVKNLDPRLDAVCLKAMAKRPTDRFASMEEFAAALEALADLNDTVAVDSAGARARAAVPAEAVRYMFVGLGSRAPLAPPGQDRLFLDVGNDLRPGVIDHHQLVAGVGSTTRLVLDYPSFVEAAVNPRRSASDPFTLLLHESPDLDCVAAACLAQHYLAHGEFPPRAAELATYLDEVDAGVRGLNQANPFDLYCGYAQLANCPLVRDANSMAEGWRERVKAGIELVQFVLVKAERQNKPLAEVDAFAGPHLTAADRADVLEDLARYRRKLAEPGTNAKIVRLRLPGEFGVEAEVDGLLVRDVQNVGDPQRCRFFKDWARSDHEASPSGQGFAALSVFCREGSGQPRRCILSTAPASRATLRGLGAALETAESQKRRGALGLDDRAHDASTGTRKIPRPGYDNADPWYDGRAHGYTIVDAAQSGTLLTADEIESIFLSFGRCQSPTSSTSN